MGGRDERIKALQAARLRQHSTDHMVQEYALRHTDFISNLLPLGESNGVKSSPIIEG